MLMKNMAATKKRKSTWNFACVSGSSFWGEKKEKMKIKRFKINSF